MEQDHYAVLGVAHDATKKEIKKAYFKLARKYHPDHNAGDAEAERRFVDVNAAYQILSDDAKRKEYDAARLRPKSRPTAGARSARGTKQARQTAASTMNFEDLSKSFAAFYGFDPKTGAVTDEEGMSQFAGRKKNPLDVSDLFEKFMGFKG